MIVQEENYLSHVGVLGMKWGQHKPRNKIKSKVSNIDKWGSDKDHNILYITGYSGSGKSTLANKFKDKNTNIISLDRYFEKLDKNISANLNDKEFTNHLNKNFPEYKTIANVKSGERNTKSHWNNVDRLMAETEKFAAMQYPKKKVIVEGVQLSDDTTYPNKNFFKDKPLAITETSALKSFSRAAKRDGKNIITSIKEAKTYMQWYGNMNQSLDKLIKTTDAKKGQDWTEKYLVKE